jgi:hypothetical protein
MKYSGAENRSFSARCFPSSYLKGLYILVDTAFGNFVETILLNSVKPYHPSEHDIRIV